MENAKVHHLVITEELRQALIDAAIHKIHRTREVITWQEYACQILRYVKVSNFRKKQERMQNNESERTALSHIG